MKKLIACAALSAAFATHSVVVYAGSSAKTTVTVTATGAYGALKATRNSSDNSELIFCSTTDLNGLPLLECYAQDKAGHSNYCYVDNAPAWLVSIVASVNETSLVDFSEIPSNPSQCATVTIYNDSANL